MQNNKDTLIHDYEVAVTKKITLRRYINEQLIPRTGKTTLMTESTGHTVCPFHDETNASFTYWGATDTCYCFGCGVGGDLLAIHRRKVLQFDGRKINRLQAAYELTQIYKLADDVEIKTLYDQLTAENGKSANVQETVFTRARYLLLNTAAMQPKADEITLPYFMKAQARILQNQSIQARCELLNDLDILAGVAIMHARAGNNMQ